MIYLSLNKAAKEASVAKSTLISALKSGRMSANKNDKGHWEIDPTELFRVFPKGGPVEPENSGQNPDQYPSETIALHVEIRFLREQIARQDAEREREREQYAEQIADHRQAMTVLNDMRAEKALNSKGVFARLFGR